MNKSGGSLTGREAGSSRGWCQNPPARTSAATPMPVAIARNSLRKRTIVISTDTAHSLGDSLDQEIGPEPLQLRDNLWAQEVDAR